MSETTSSATAERRPFAATGNISRKGLFGAERNIGPGRQLDPPPQPAASGHTDRNSLLWSVSLRFASGRKRMEGVAPTVYPCVPGHEIVGRVVKAGSAVKKFKEGDLSAVGCMVGSCGVCASCSEGVEQYCEQIPGAHLQWRRQGPGRRNLLGIRTASSSMKRSRSECPISLIPPLPPRCCARASQPYSPLRHWNARKGQKVGVVGLGGLGHMALKFTNAFGAHVVLFTTSLTKLRMRCGWERTKSLC